jgi:hypothetical protein
LEGADEKGDAVRIKRGRQIEMKDKFCNWKVRHMIYS